MGRKFKELSFSNSLSYTYFICVLSKYLNKPANFYIYRDGGYELSCNAASTHIAKDMYQGNKFECWGK